VSTDDRETSGKFKASLKAPYSFVADEQGVLVKQYDVKMFLIGVAKRVTFVIGPGRKVLMKQEGSDALDPSGSVTACSLKPPEALKFVTGAVDGGVLDAGHHE
jgi:peroxiredoxin